MNRLFRQEVIERKRIDIFGEVLLSQPYAYKALFIVICFIFFLIILVLIFGNYARREKVQGFINTDKGVIKVFPQSPGTIYRINISEGKKVNKGDVLAIIHTSKQTESGRNLVSLLNREMQQRKVILKQQIDNESQLINLEIEQNNQLLQSYKNKQHLAEVRMEHLKKQLEINEKIFNKVKKLESNSYISSQQLANKEIEVLQIRSQIKLLEQEMDFNNLELKRLSTNRQQIETRKKQKMMEIETKLVELQQSMIEMDGLGSYAIKSIVNGYVSSIQARLGETVSLQRPLLSIIPEKANFQAELLIPSRAVGFIKEGHEVLIRYDAFPYQRFGQYKGRLVTVADSISLPGELPVPVTLSEPVYRAKVELNKQYIEAYSKKFPLKSGMLISVDILLEERSFFEWLFEPLISLKGRL